MRVSIFAFMFLFTATPFAQAHIGHVGELAGHAHWLGVGAVVAAGVLAALLAKARKENEASGEAEDDTSGDGETEAEPA